MDCGPTCLRMIAKSYSKHYSPDTLRQLTGFSREGVSLLGICDTAEKLGFRTRGLKLKTSQLEQVQLPCILHWNQDHYVVLVGLSRWNRSNGRAEVADPEKGIIQFKREEFVQFWASTRKDNEEAGVALLLEPTPSFYERQGETEKKMDWGMILGYLRGSGPQIFQVFAALLLISLTQLVFPFLTQSIVDTGINTQNLHFVVVILMAQLMLAFSQTAAGFLRSRLLLRISNVLNIQILSDFWIKLTKLPLSYFDVHHTSDTLQRINDHKQIQDFLTGSALNTLFSVLSFTVYSLALVIYDVRLFFVFCAGSAIYFCWVQLFLKIRRRINYENFHLATRENSATLQFIQGMQDIRLNNAQRRKRWEWENIQAKVFRLNFRRLNYGQVQETGAIFINQVQGIVMSFIVAKLVIAGQLTFGAMLAIQYIIGQLNGPIQQWVGFVQSLQDARISVERLNEIHQLRDEEDPEKQYSSQLPEHKDIILDHVSFTYPGSGNEPVLKDINLVIPENKVTAIVGTSGSGKTTLVKLLLKIYEEYEGDIRIGYGSKGSDMGGVRFGFIQPDFWRNSCGAVLQDGFIFNDSIARNIAVGEDEIDLEKLVRSCKIANIHSFIESLPNGYHTRLGAEGVDVSQGQKQRILIARAVYKDPEYLFFDEATNALDANNEREIVDNLQTFFKGKTVIVVAHRLSTVRNADRIILLDKGCIAETGSHEQLTALRGKYFELVKNQLELGN